MVAVHVCTCIWLWFHDCMLGVCTCGLPPQMMCQYLLIHLQMIIMVAVRACVCVWRLKRIFDRYHHQFSTLLPDSGPLMQISVIGREILAEGRTRTLLKQGGPQWW